MPINITGWLLRLAVKESPDYTVTGKDEEDKSQLPLFEQPSVQAKVAEVFARSCASVAFELALAPTMLRIHLVNN